MYGRDGDLDYDGAFATAGPAGDVGAKRLFAAGAAWGLLASFSYLTPAPVVAQGAALVLAAAVVSTITVRWLASWAWFWTGWLIALHALVALFSGLTNRSEPGFVIRYLLLVPAMSMALFAASKGVRAANALRGGLTLSGVCFVAYHLAAADLSRLSDPSYRLSVYLNPNGVAFIAGMTGVSLFDYGLRRLHASRTKVCPVALAAFAGLAACLVVCLATKSRTATLATAVGLAVRLYTSLGFARTLALSAAAALVMAVAWGAVLTVAETASSTFQLNDPLRAVSGGTGRFQAWRILVAKAWLPNFAFGAGPGSDLELSRIHTSVRSSHNGVLANLVEVGLVGTLPLIVVLIMAARGALRAVRVPDLAFAASLFAVAVVESMAETMFFSMGNPGSLLFVTSVAVLSTSGNVAPTHPAPDEGGEPIAYAY
jgi:O-antigen ligase